MDPIARLIFPDVPWRESWLSSFFQATVIPQLKLDVVLHRQPMSHNHIPDFDDNELWVVRRTLKERYGKEVEPQLADTEVMLGSGVEGLSWCPALFWSAKGANFTIVKIGPKRYRAYFYFHPEDQLGTGIDSYDEIGDCIVSVLQVEADYTRAQKIKSDEAATKNGEDSPDKTDTSPIFWGD